MRAKKLLAMIVAQQRNKLDDIDIVSKELRNRGRTNEEIETAIKIACCISYFDSLFFDDGISINFVSREAEDDQFAAYSHPSMAKDVVEEGYFVYAKNLPSKINSDGCKINSFSMNGKLSRLEASKEEFLIRIAVHEIRHRLQYNKRIKLFLRNKSYRKPIDYSIRFYKSVYEYQKEMYEKEEKSEDYIAKKLSDTEFDAEIIESVFLDKLHKGKGLKELCQIVKMER